MNEEETYSKLSSHGVADLYDAKRRLNWVAQDIHKINEKWWKDIETGQPIKRNVGELLMLAVSELSEALEGHRKDLMDDKLPHRKMFEVEIADCMIRLFDIAAGTGTRHRRGRRRKVRVQPDAGRSPDRSAKSSGRKEVLTSHHPIRE
jgi:hypothetical protein